MGYSSSQGRCCTKESKSHWQSQYPLCLFLSTRTGIYIHMGTWNEEHNLKGSDTKLEYDLRSWPLSGCGIHLSCSKYIMMCLSTVSGSSMHQQSLQRNLFLFILVFSTDSLLHVPLPSPTCLQGSLSYHSRRNNNLWPGTGSVMLLQFKGT